MNIFHPLQVFLPIFSVNGKSFYELEDDVDANGVDVTGPSIIETTVLTENSIAVIF